MRPLRTCDFCDADAIGTFAVVPAELEPTDDEQRRVLLCEACSDRLETLLEPLVARVLEDTEPSNTDESVADEPAADSSRTTRDPQATTTHDPQATATATENGTDSVSDADPESDTESGITFDADEAMASADSSERVEPVLGGEDEPEADGEDEDGSEPDTNSESVSGTDSLLEETPAADELTETNDGESGRDDKPASAVADALENSTSEPDASTGEADDTERPTSGESQRRPPRAYRKTVRLLRNREFPMERNAVEQLAAGAYDLEEETAEAIVDYAVANDEFVERGGELHRS